MKEFFSVERFRRADWLTLAYIFIWIVLIIIFYERIHAAGLFLMLHFLVFLMAFLLSGLSPENWLMQFWRRWYPFGLVLLFFTALHYLIPPIRQVTLDVQLIKIDLWLFGTHPTVWFEKFYHPLMTEILQLSYLTFYLFPLILLVPYFVKRRWLEFDRFSFAILLTFYLSYFGYLLFPALGPRYFLAHFHDIQLSGKGIYHAIRDTLDGLENIQWDAFPSGHVGIALVYLHFAFRYFRRIFYVSCFVVLLLILSTVYLRYHYVVDVLGGVILYGIVVGTDRAMRWPAPESKFKDFN